MSRRVLRSELARLAGVTKPALTKLAKGRLAKAFGSDGWVDLDHPLVVEWLESKGVSPTAVRPPREKARARTPTTRPVPPPPVAKAGARRALPPPAPAGPEQGAERGERRATGPDLAAAYISQLGEGLDIEGLAQMTLQEIIERWGTEARFRDLLEARKRLGEIVEKDLKNDETIGRLIDRDLVKTHVFGLIDSLLKQLFRDAATNIARTTYGMARGGKSLEEAETTVRDILASHVKDVKAKAAKVLRA